jgi:hypothetical protein
MYSHTITALEITCGATPVRNARRRRRRLLIRYLNVWGGGGMFLHHLYPDRGPDDFDQPETAFTSRTTRGHIETAEFWMVGQPNAAMHLSRRWDDVL